MLAFSFNSERESGEREAPRMGKPFRSGFPLRTPFARPGGAAGPSWTIPVEDGGRGENAGAKDGREMAGNAGLRQRADRRGGGKAQEIGAEETPRRAELWKRIALLGKSVGWRCTGKAPHR